ncbi:MAG TPA: hypothetical protein PLI95_14540 [Polyangiaceae bacterium]|nr:hypothetical protein [Polyangiaceae bacterium]
MNSPTQDSPSHVASEPADDGAPFRRWLPSPVFWPVVAAGTVLGLGTSAMLAAGWTLAGWIAASGVTLIVVVGLMPRRLVVDAEGVQLWWFGRRTIPFSSIHVAEAARTGLGDYLRLGLDSGESLSIMTRARLAAAALLSPSMSMADAFPTELLARVIARRAQARHSPGEQNAAV